MMRLSPVLMFLVGASFGSPLLLVDAGLTEAEALRAATLGPAEPDTIRYTLVPNGIPSGERLIWTDPPNVWHSTPER